MSFISVNSFLRNYEAEKQQILRDLRSIVRDCREKYGHKTELATEADPKIIRLSDCWELLLFHGLHTNVFKASTSFWDIAEGHLTRHEKERFSTLRHVHTDRGKVRALLRAALNEHSLERYVLMWLNDETLETKYEPWACLLNSEIVAVLPELAKNLTTILFALTVDSPELNVDRKLNMAEKEEPIILVPVVPEPKRHKKPKPVERDILEKCDRVQAKIPEPTSPKMLTPMSSETSSNNGSFQDNDFMFQIEPVPEPEVVREIFEAAKVKEEAPEPEISSNSSVSSKNSSVVSLHEPPPLSVFVPDDLEVLRSKLRAREERIIQLEKQVADLSLENCRLRMLSSSARQTKILFNVAVPKAYLQRQVPSGKQYYVYEIHVTPTSDIGETWLVKRRYSEFYTLHKRLGDKDPSIRTLDFPPKKKFGNFDAVFVEQRRQRLHVYLKHLISVLPDVAECCSRSELTSTFPFLDPDAKI